MKRKRKRPNTPAVTAEPARRRGRATTPESAPAPKPTNATAKVKPVATSKKRDRPATSTSDELHAARAAGPPEPLQQMRQMPQGTQQAGEPPQQQPEPTAMTDRQTLDFAREFLRRPGPQAAQEVRATQVSGSAVDMAREFLRSVGLHPGQPSEEERQNQQAHQPAEVEAERLAREKAEREARQTPEPRSRKAPVLGDL